MTIINYICLLGAASRVSCVSWKVGRKKVQPMWAACRCDPVWLALLRAVYLLPEWCESKAWRTTRWPQTSFLASLQPSVQMSKLKSDSDLTWINKWIPGMEPIIQCLVGLWENTDTPTYSDISCHDTVLYMILHTVLYQSVKYSLCRFISFFSFLFLLQRLQI